MKVVFFAFLFLFAILLIAIAVGLVYLESRRKKQVASMFDVVSGQGGEAERPVVLLQRPDERDLVTRILDSVNLRAKIQPLISQAGMETDITQLAVLSLVLAAVGAAIGAWTNFLVYRWFSGLVAGCIVATLPALSVHFKRKKRLAEIETQFPEALDFLSRSMRAGHAFSISLEMLGQETPDPLGRELRNLFIEQNLGAAIETALRNLQTRVPLVDMRFFVSSVMLQRQTGGNLAEILTRLGYLIRERFQLKGQVKAASAHGRMTAGVLSVLPIVTMLALLFVAPGYLQGMAADPDGRKLIYGAIGAQLLGYYVIHKIIDIKV
jgi:tight adherence protein B